MSFHGLRTFLVPLSFALLLPITGTGLAQNKAPGKYVKDASDRLAKMIDTAAADHYEFPLNSFSYGGAFLKKDANAWVPIFTVQLLAGRSYIFLAAGDTDTRDLDMD